MRKLIVLSFISLDGVMQGPGGPEEDRSGGFKLGGWTVGYFDEFAGQVMSEQMGRPFDLLLGRKTYQIFASYWPLQRDEDNPGAAGLNKAIKYVASKSLKRLDWGPSVLLSRNIAQAIRKLKSLEGPDLHVHGSGNLIQTLLKNDLVDELWLKIFPLTLGRGKRLFDAGTTTAAFELVKSSVSPLGVIVANYRRAGDVKTGTFAAPSPADTKLPAAAGPKKTHAKR
jgi:dihydrofolate reductase